MVSPVESSDEGTYIYARSFHNRMKKKIQDGSLYYRQKDILRPIGSVLLPVGLVALWLGYGWISYIFATVAIPLGLVLFFLGGLRLITDTDLQEQLDHAMLDYDKEITDMTGYERIVLKQPAPVEISAYCFGEKARYFKKGKKGTLVSDVYVRSRLFFTKDTLILVSRKLSVAELNEATGEGITDTCLYIPFSAVKSVELVPHENEITLTNTGKTLTAPWCELLLVSAQGERITIPVQNDMDAANLIEAITRRMSA